jgi:hypothetical protein
MDRHTPQTKRVSQEVKDSLRYLRVIHRIDLRIQDHKGDVFMVGADGRAEESEDTLGGVLLLQSGADDKATWDQRLRVHRSVRHWSKDGGVLIRKGGREGWV